MASFHDRSEPFLMDITHDFLYVSPTPARSDGIFYRTNRCGVTMRTPVTFHNHRLSDYRFVVIHCVLRGKGYVTLDGRTYTANRGELFLLPAFREHDYRSDGDDPMGISWVEFCGGNSAPIADYILRGHSPVFGEPYFSRVLTLITAMMVRLDQNNETDAGLDLYEILIELSRAASANDRGNDIVAYVDDHYTGKLTLEDIAAEFGYNPSYVSRKFRDLTGETFSHYLYSRRIRRACYLLLATDMSLEAIASSLGFFDTSHFILRFREAEGVTPAFYRKQNKGLVAAPK